jgi:hypothetical protein
MNKFPISNDYVTTEYTEVNLGDLKLDEINGSICIFTHKGEDLFTDSVTATDNAPELPGVSVNLQSVLMGQMDKDGYTSGDVFYLTQRAIDRVNLGDSWPQPRHFQIEVEVGHFLE